MQHPGFDTSSFGPHRGEKEHTTSMRVPLMIGIEVSYGPKILASEGNPALYVQVDCNGNM